MNVLLEYGRHSTMMYINIGHRNADWRQKYTHTEYPKGSHICVIYKHNHLTPLSCSDIFVYVQYQILGKFWNWRILLLLSLLMISELLWPSWLNSFPSILLPHCHANHICEVTDLKIFLLPLTHCSTEQTTLMRSENAQPSHNSCCNLWSYLGVQRTYMPCPLPQLSKNHMR